MKCSKQVVKKSSLALIAFIVIASGCASHPPDMSKGLVACCYESMIKPPDGNTRQIPVSLGISALERDPYEHHISPRFILSFIPIVSFVNMAKPTGTEINPDYARLASHKTRKEKKSKDRDRNRNKYQAETISASPGDEKKAGELEEILKQEIQKSGLVRDVSLTQGGKRSDFEIRGKVNLIHNLYLHTSGLGILYIGLLPMFTLPSSSQESACEAHFDVVSTKDNRVLLSKDYYAKARYADGPVYRGIEKSLWAYGEEVFPEIVQEFVEDMQSLPRDAWIRQTALKNEAEQGIGVARKRR